MWKAKEKVRDSAFPCVCVFVRGRRGERAAAMGKKLRVVPDALTRQLLFGSHHSLASVFFESGFGFTVYTMEVKGP